jgi:DNA-binding MarR family transcriptional regulator
MKRRDDETHEADPKITLSDVARYLGVGRRVVSRLVKEGIIKIKKDPLDSRRKLVSVRELDQLKRESSKKSN